MSDRSKFDVIEVDHTTYAHHEPGDLYDGGLVIDGLGHDDDEGPHYLLILKKPQEIIDG
jgi:hypothetical protein